MVSDTRTLAAPAPGLAAAGFTGASVTFSHEAATGMHSAIIRAVKPVTA